MPKKPRFLRKMMGFDGGVRVPASATLRCTSKNPTATTLWGFAVYRKSKQKYYGVRVVACATLRLARSSSYGAPGNSPATLVAGVFSCCKVQTPM